VPGPGDTAIIPNSKTCTVDDARTTEIVTVNTGGTLTVVEGGSLTIDFDLYSGNPAQKLTVAANATVIINDTLTLNNTAGDAAPPPKLTVNGTVDFQKTATATPTILYGDLLIIEGSGNLQALGQNGHGVIDNLNGSEHVLQIESGVTVNGSFTIKCDNVEVGMKLDGTFLVDNADDDMLFTGSSPVHPLRGSGTFSVSDGNMIFASAIQPVTNFAGSLQVAGGNMIWTSILPPSPNAASVTISGGLLWFFGDWESHGGIEFTGGTIRVAKNKMVSFIDP
jgi:hypothetical protein